MANKNIGVVIQRPGYENINKMVFEKYVANDVINIPRRTPYTRILNLAKLKEDGFFRSESHEVTTDYGGNNAKDGFTNLGLTLPRTEKLILMIKNPGVGAVKIKVSGNVRAGINEIEVDIPAGVEGDLYTFDLFDLGFHITDETKSAVLTIDKPLEMVLVARY